jgi:hypothetical protein
VWVRHAFVQNSDTNPLVRSRDKLSIKCCGGVICTGEMRQGGLSCLLPVVLRLKDPLI